MGMGSYCLMGIEFQLRDENNGRMEVKAAQICERA